MAIRQFSGLIAMVVQTVIFITGFFAIWLSQDERSHFRKYACIFGLVGQPFWFYTSFMMEQWGIMALTFIYTIAWARGVFVHWLKPKSSR